MCDTRRTNILSCSLARPSVSPHKAGHANTSTLPEAHYYVLPVLTGRQMPLRTGVPAARRHALSHSGPSASGLIRKLEDETNEGHPIVETIVERLIPNRLLTAGHVRTYPIVDSKYRRQMRQRIHSEVFRWLSAAAGNRLHGTISEIELSLDFHGLFVN